jgi:cytochrome c553
MQRLIGLAAVALLVLLALGVGHQGLVFVAQGEGAAAARAAGTCAACHGG